MSALRSALQTQPRPVACIRAFHGATAWQRTKSKAKYTAKRERTEARELLHKMSSSSTSESSTVREFLSQGKRRQGSGPWEVWPQDDKIDEKFARKQRQLSLEQFRSDPGVHTRCANFGVDKATFEKWSAEFVREASEEKIEKLKASSLVPKLKREGQKALERFVTNQFFAFLSERAPEVVKNLEYLRKISDMRYPHEWMPLTRKQPRRIIMHVGPTNSGKTYHALQRLQSARSGIYCSPLRLLAFEVYQRMNKAGIACELRTGEDRRLPNFEDGSVEPAGYSALGAPVTGLVSCTIEMAPLGRCQVAVVDEIQMIADQHRGWAWTSALLNVPAAELHLCGEESAVPIVKRICATLDEDVEVRTYGRLGALKTSSKSLEYNWKRIQPGDCVVTFSRKNIYNVKQTIEAQTGLRCAVIYGGLPPEARVEQARLFNEEGTGYDVLVASDAIGMGINLSIKRVVFTALSKFDGGGMRPISVSQTRQIGGRAGRFGSGSEIGEVTTMAPNELKLLAQSMSVQPPMITAAGLKPTVEAIETFSHQFPSVPFSQLWPMFRDIATIDDEYFLCSFADQEAIALAIEDLPMSVRDRYQFLYAPINMREEVVATCVRRYAEYVAYSRQCRVGMVVRMPKAMPTTRDALKIFEQWHRAITLFLWLSFHFPESFIEIEEAMEMKQQCERMILDGLAVIKAETKQRAKKTIEEFGFSTTVKLGGKASKKSAAGDAGEQRKPDLQSILEMLSAKA
ncbi:RNA helicase [Coemansia interrupta]|uniref:RNA helicase n=1 Tax=Coemansia interrupta TaxID=1126814 RepID=A0A9W8LDB3_9FUNG|nr:RNA helicase [Coemansia interrupta]